MNGEELKKEWSDVFELILSYDSVDTSQARALLSRLQPQAMSEDFILLTADNGWLRNWIEKHYGDVIKRALKELKGNDFVVMIEVDENQESPAPAASDNQSEQPTESVKSANNEDTSSTVQHANSAEPTSTAEAPRPCDTDNAALSVSGKAKLPGSGAISDTGAAMSQAGADAMGNDIAMPTSSLTFANFVIGASNQMAYSMAVAVAENPGNQMLNPLFIYGKSGLGKTHLMRAIQNHVNETHPELKTIYVDSADFLNEFVDAALTHDEEKTSFKNFKTPYQEADVLIIDDIQYFQDKSQTIDIVFQIFNNMIDHGKQVVLSSDRAPKNITMDERYLSRFNGGATFDIQPPEVETKLGIIRSFVEEYCTTSNRPNFTLDDEIERYIAENSGSNIRELKSAVTKIIFAMNSFGRENITTQEVSKLLENHFSGGAMKKLSIADIQDQVQQYYDIPHTDLVGQKRARKIVHARKVAIYLCRELLDLPYSYIAKCFGGRDHTTIMYSYTNIHDKMKTNRELAEEIENIKRRIKEM